MGNKCFAQLSCVTGRLRAALLTKKKKKRWMNNKIKINALDLLVVVEAPLRVHLHQLTPCDSQLLLRPPTPFHLFTCHFHKQKSPWNWNLKKSTNNWVYCIRAQHTITTKVLILMFCLFCLPKNHFSATNYVCDGRASGILWLFTKHTYVCLTFKGCKNFLKKI